LKKSNQLTFTINQVTLRATHGETILEACLRNHFDIDHSCGGMGTCGTCRVVVEKGLELFEAPEEIEQEIIRDRQFQQNERLSCQNKVKNDLVLKTAKATPKKG
jgi:2Fe-2S ferredoxin